MLTLVTTTVQCELTQTGMMTKINNYAATLQVVPSSVTVIHAVTSICGHNAVVLAILLHNET